MDAFVIEVGGWDWSEIEEVTGYKPITTFWSDFSIAERFKGGIEDTYKRAFNEWKSDVKYITELSMVLNWKSWWWSKRNREMALLYQDLWIKTHDWCLDNLKGDDLSYYLNITN
jgi:hypothetical protein